jgi:hypothetical protein
VSRRLEIVSLRKSAALVQEAAEIVLGGGAVAVPTECGYFRVQLHDGAVRLACAAPELPDDRLQLAAETFWPGPMWLRLPGSGTGGKVTWYVPSHPLAQALLRATGCPVWGECLRDSSGGSQCGEPDDPVTLVWKERPQGLQPSEVDVAGLFWRWLRTGFVERREFEWITGSGTLLSSAAVPEPRLAAVPGNEMVSEELPYWRVEV